MRRLVEETACEHGEWGECRESVQWSTLVSRPCPGGSSRELTVDYEAAAKGRYENHRNLLVATAEKNDKLMILPAWEELDDDERARRIGEAKSIIYRALGGGR